MRTGIDNPTINVYSFSSAEQTVILPADTVERPLRSITLRYWYRARVDGGDYAYVFFRLAGAGWRLWQITRQNVDGWTQVVHDLRAYAGKTVTLRFGTYNNGRDGTSLMYVDDVSLEICVP